MVEAITALSGVAAGVILPTAIRRSTPADRLEKPGRLDPSAQDRFETESVDGQITAADGYDRWGRPVKENASQATSGDRAAKAYPPPDPKLAIAANLTEEQRQEVEQLRKRDTEVRAHERAHKSAGGDLAGAVSFTYKQGPDGQQYAVGGEVSIDVSPVRGDPQATIAKMQRVRRAALAPANPSGQDRAVAAEAARIEREARAELARKGGGAGAEGAATASALGSNSFDDSAEEDPAGSLLDLIA